MSLVKDTLHELFTYDNGKLYWKINKGNVKAGSEITATNAYGYKVVGIDGKLYQVHRVIYIMHYGHIPQRKLVDHINRNTLDNRIENLRVVTPQENQFNSKAKGCCWVKAKNKFKAYIVVNNKQIHLGYFNDEQEARNAYLKAKEKYHKIEEVI